jgi:hypothetical protein
MHQTTNRSHTFCEGMACQVKVRSPMETTVLSYVVSAVVLVFPLLNALTAKVQNILPLAGLNVNVTAIAIGAAWLISGYVSSRERHTHIYSILLGACGLPGAVLALLALGRL